MCRLFDAIIYHTSDDSTDQSGTQPAATCHGAKQFRVKPVSAVRKALRIIRSLFGFISRAMLSILNGSMLTYLSSFDGSIPEKD